MFKSFEFCLPTRSTIVPDSPDCLHEVKYDGSPHARSRAGIICLLGLSGGSRCLGRVGFFTPLQKVLKQMLGLLVSSRLARR